MSDHFNEKAKDWDADEIINQLSSAIGTAILKNVPLSKNWLVMDFGAGTGLISAHVAPLVNKIMAVDISEAMLSKLVAKPELQGRVVAVCQDILSQPVDAKFDLIMSAMAMHHVENTDKLIRRFYEQLKTGAMIALADLDKEDGSFHPAGTDGIFHAGFEREILQASLERYGFHDVCFNTVHVVEKNGKRYPVFLVLAKK